MTAQPLVIVGAGGFGREVIQMVDAINDTTPTYAVVGVADDQPSPAALASLARAGVSYLGPVADSLTAVTRDAEVVLAVGDPAVRRRLATLMPADLRAGTIVHPDTTIGSGTTLGAGCVIGPGARISVDVTLGDHVQIDQNVAVGHDSIIGNCSRLNPCACVSGNVELGVGCYIGANATVLQGLKVGPFAVVAAGAVVVRDTPGKVTVKGVPAR